MDRSKAKPITWTPSQPLLSLSLAKHPDPAARALKGIEVRAGREPWDYTVRAKPVSSSYVVMFGTDFEGVGLKPGNKTPAKRYPVSVASTRNTDNAEQPAAVDKEGGYPFFVQHDYWEGSKNPDALINLVTWATERIGKDAALWAGDAAVLNVWKGPGAKLNVESAMY